MATTSSGGLQLGVFFDFDKGKAKGIKDVEEYMEKLQQLINKKKLYFTGGIDPKFKSYTDQYKNSIEDINKRIKDIRKEWSKLKGEGGIFEAGTGKLTDNARKLAQEYRELNALRKNSMLTIDELQKRIDKQMRDEQKRMQQLSGEYKKQGGYLQHLIQRMTVYASIGAVMGFLTKVREVTAEFELQRISLGAIIQDQNKANALFSEIKNFALKSPVKILDLTKYTKQLAAYRIETDKLFDTTKRLADISVGLGVDMQRIILFYGQVRAAGYLRASEVRQATEAGIPLVEELAQKLSQARGELVTVGQVMDMISKRQISFQDVADVFEDLTNKGGIFYNMQEKQGNTLYGMWQKLGDAAQVMYDQIGNTSAMSGALKFSINLLRSLMLAWRDVAKAVEVASIGYLAFKVNSRVLDIITSSTLRLGVATTKEAEAEFRLNEARARGNWLLTKSAQWKLKAAQWSTKAAQANNIATWSYYKLGAAVRSVTAALVAFWPMLAVTIVASAWAAIDSYIEKTNRLKKALDEVKESANIEISKSVQNFESLANAAVNARDGSKEQRDALEELQTTYGKMIPAQDLQIEKLREMAGNYDLLTEAIRNNIAAQKMQEGVTTIIENYVAKEKEWSDKIRKALVEKGIGYWMMEDGKEVTKSLKLTEEQYSRMIANVEKLARTTSMSMRDIWKQVFKGEGFDPIIVDRIDNAKFLQNSNEFIIALRNEENALNDWKKGMRETYPSLEKFADLLIQAKENIKNATFTAKEGTFEFDQQQLQTSVFAYEQAIAQALKDSKSKIKISDFITVDETSPEQFMLIDFEGLKKAILEEGGELSRQAHDLVKVIQQEFLGLVPTDPTVRLLRSKLIEITNSFDVVGFGMNKMKQYFWDGSETLKKQVKTWKDELKTMREQIYTYSQTIKTLGKLGELAFSLAGIDVAVLTAQADALEKLIAEAEKLVLADEKKGKKSDPRLQILNNIASTMEKINKEYDDLLKKEGQTQALADTQRLFAEEFANLQKIANKYKFQLPAFEVPKNASEVAKWYKAVADEIRRLKIKDADRILIDLGYKEGKVDIDELQKQIEQRLKDLQSRIEQSKAAKEFYDKILSATGDVNIAADVTMSIYGDTGSQLDAQLASEIKEMFGQYEVEVPVSVVGDDNRIDYLALEKYVRQMQQELGGVDSKTYQDLLKIAQQGQKDWAKTYEGYLKDLEKAKSYSDKRIELARKTAEKIASIRKGEAGNLSKYEQDRLIKGEQEKEAKEAANLAYEAFKDSPMYVQMFEDLDYASTTMLKNMKARLQSLQGEWKNLSPQNLKEMQKRLDEINKQLIKRNPFKTLSEAIREYRELSKDGSAADADKELAKWSMKRQEAEKALNKVLEERQDDADAIKVAQDLVDYTQKNEEEAQKLVERWKKVKETIGLSVQELYMVMDMFVSVARTVADLTETFGGSEDDVKYWNDIADGLDKVSSGVQDIINAALDLDIMGVISSALTAIPKMIIGFAEMFQAGRIRKANKEIKRQQELLEQLEYTYSRLQKAADKLFGTDYIQNYNLQLENLQATAEAYRKQMEAEQSKGKKADKDKIKEYADAYQSVMDEIADRQDELTDKFLGTDRASAARDFAQSWFEAKLAFENTADAIEDKYKDMIQNMIVEGAAAKIIDNLLAPMWRDFDAMLGGGDIETAISTLIEGMDDFVLRADNGLNVLYESLKAKGYDLQEILGEGKETDLTGIARDVATASEESINGLAQGINTQNYYISHVPTISENVAAIRILMEGGAVAQTGGDLLGMQNEHLAQLPIIAANTLATAERCERAAIACEQMRDSIVRVVVSKGNGFALKTQWQN